jgi:hypothetical protein
LEQLLNALKTELHDSSKQKAPVNITSQMTSNMQPQEVDATALGYQEFKFKSFLGRQRTVNRMTDAVGELWRVFQTKDSTPTFHPSLTLTNGHGTGKSRFCKEAIDQLKKGKTKFHSCVYFIFVIILGYFFV